MFYVNLEKKSPISGAWTERKCVFDTERRYFYYSDRSGLLNSGWKHAMKVNHLRIECLERPFDLSTLHGADARNLYMIHIEGALREINSDLKNVKPAMNPRAAADAILFQRPARGKVSLDSPRKVEHRPFLKGGITGNRISSVEKHVEWTFRCDSSEMFFKVVDVLTDVLADNGMCPPLHGGLPPCVDNNPKQDNSASNHALLFAAKDPRNGLPLSRVPPHLLYSLKSLDRTVNYCLERGDLVGATLNGQICAALAGGYLSITDEMVLIMRENASVPRWITLQSITDVHYNTTANVPFIALLTSGPSPDIIFMPSPPSYGPEEIKSYSPIKAIERIIRILKILRKRRQEVLKATNKNGAAIEEVKFVEVNQYKMLSRYVIAECEKRPFKFSPVPGFSQPLICPLPREQLVATLASGQGQHTESMVPITKTITTSTSRANGSAAGSGSGAANVLGTTPGNLRRLNQTPVVFGASRTAGGQKITSGALMGASPRFEMPAAMGTSVGIGGMSMGRELANDSFLRGAHSAIGGMSMGADPDLALSFANSRIGVASLPAGGLHPTAGASVEFDDDLDDGEAHLDDIVNESFAAMQPEGFNNNNSTLDT